MFQEFQNKEPKQAIYQLSQHTGIAKGQLEDSLIQEATKAIGWEQYVAPFVAKLNEVVVNIGLPAIKEEEVA